MRIRLIINSFLAACTLGLSSLAMASPDLIIHNNTDFYSTTKSLKRACSSEFPEKAGITPPHQTKSTDSRIVKAACLGHSEDCSAEVYLTNNCSGPVIAKVLFSVNSGLISKENIPGSGYCLSGRGFEFSIDPNPSNQPCA